MHKYEMIFITQPELDENAIKGINEKVNGWITTAGGTIEKVDVWGKRRMAYSIRKQREGLYVLTNFTMPPTASAELERNLRFTETIIRFMITVIG
jgi:small subunit ribosomal protein S6